MHYEFKNIDRCSSQQINDTQVNQSTSSHKSQKPSDISTQLHQLLTKIQCLNNKKQQPQITPHKPRTKIIQKQGKTEDQPHRPSVLSIHKSKRSKQASEKSSPVGSRHHQQQQQQQKQQQKQQQQTQHQYVEREIKEVRVESGKLREENSNQFYKYCTDEIVRVSTENSNLEKNLQRTLEILENEKKNCEDLRKANLKLVKQMNQFKSMYQRTNQQLSVLRCQIQDTQRDKLQKQKQQLDSLAQNTKMYEAELNKYRKIIAQKDEQNNRLLNEIKTLKIQSIQNIETSEQNKRLGKKVAQLMANSKYWQDKARGKSEAVDHLWTIKQIQYGNIIDLISRSRRK